MSGPRPGLTLFELSGWKARLMNVILGTPFFGFGGLVVLLAVVDATGPGRVILLAIGGIPAFVGLVLYRRAIRGDDFTLRLSITRGSSRDAS